MHFQVTQFAIFGGRGGRNYHCPFHQAYLDERDRLRVQYLIAKTNAEKRLLQEQLVQWVYFQGGEFYIRNDRGSYDVMTKKEKLKKTAQALREKRKKQRPIHQTMTFPVPQLIHVVSNGDGDFEINDMNTFAVEIESNIDENVLPFPEDDGDASCNTLFMEIDDDSLMTFPIDMDDDIEIDELSDYFAEYISI